MKPITTLAVLSSDCQSDQVKEAKALGFRQIVTVETTNLEVPTIINRWASHDTAGELKSAILWSKGFNLWFLDATDRTEWKQIVEGDAAAEGLTSFWPAHLDRVLVAKADPERLFDLRG